MKSGKSDMFLTNYYHFKFLLLLKKGQKCETLKTRNNITYNLVSCINTGCKREKTLSSSSSS